MNNRIEISGFVIKFKDGTSTNVPSSINDIALNPFYASIHDIEIAVPFGTAKFEGESLQRVSELIFNKSIWIDTYLKRKDIQLSPEEMFMLKRDFVICAVLAQLGSLLYGTLLKGQSVKKVLGDFEVARTSSFEPSAALRFANDAKECYEDILKAIDDMSRLMAENFVLGRWNCANKRSDRLWHHPKFLSRMPIGANKYLESDGRYYKTGFGHGNEYLPLYTRS